MLFRRILAAQRRFKSVTVSANTNNVVHHFQDIPAPKGLPIIGTTLQLIKAGSAPNLHNYVDRRHKEFGPIYKEKVGPMECVFIADPDEMRHVFAQEGKYPKHMLPDAWMVYNKMYGCKRGLFFMDGDFWWTHRKIMNKLLLKGDLNWIDKSCDSASENLINHLKSVMENKTESEYPLLFEDTLYKWSLDNLVAILLGVEIYKINRKQLELDLEKLAKIVHLVFQTTVKLQLMPASLASKLNIRPWKDFVKSVDDALSGANELHLTLANILYKIKPQSADGLLLKLFKEDIQHNEIGKIIADLILAAGDTTAYAMEWMLYLLAKNKNSQEELRANPHLAKYYIRETLRLYPVAPFLTRILPEDSILCGYEVPKETLIILSIYTSGRDERYFKEPLKFYPRRWDRDFNKDYKIEMQKASLPFAMGLRSCIGKKIAETQMTTTLMKIVENFDVSVCNEKDVDVTLKMVVVPAEPIRFKFQRRYD